MAVDTTTFLRSAAIWMMSVAVGFTVIFFGMSYATQMMPANTFAPTAPSGVGGAEARAGAASSVGSPGDWPAPNFRLPSLDGQTLGPPDFAGDVVVVELWASWCGPCRIQARFLEELHKEFDGKGVHFLAVNSGESETTARAYQAKTPFPYPVLLDPRESIRARYGSNGLPTVMVIDRSGEVSLLKVGVLGAPALRVEIERALRAESAA
ncbi:MAG: TlpA disulfide reductase family protein [Acidobacteriota bacterium]